MEFVFFFKKNLADQPTFSLDVLQVLLVPFQPIKVLTFLNPFLSLILVLRTDVLLFNGVILSVFLFNSYLIFLKPTFQFPMKT